METYPFFDPNQRNFNYSDVLNGDCNTKGGQNLQAITVYIYQKMFIVSCLFSFSLINTYKL